MGGAGNLPAPVGNLPTGMAAGVALEPPPGLIIDAAPVPSGRLPGDTGWQPVLPLTAFSNRLLKRASATRVELTVSG